jgi:uncharacterized protein YcbK (DUF882 family)
MDAASFRNEDACRARDEAAGLRSEMCQLRLRLEEVEEDRNYNAAKTNELQELLRDFKKEHVHDVLVKKSLQVAEMSMSLDKLQGEIKALKAENQKLKRGRQEDKKKMQDLSDVVRSLQCASYSSDEDDDDDEEEVVLTPEKALDMTLKNMKFYVEVLEDERQNLSMKCKDQESKIAMLEKESELNNVKVEMLEELFRSLNQSRIDSAPRPPLEKANSSPNLLADKPIAGAKPRRTISRTISRNSRYQRPKTFVKIGSMEGIYTGPLIEGKPNGVGAIKFENGSTYLGEVLDGKMHGKGTLYHSDKDLGISRGFFEDNEFVDPGKKAEKRDETASK